MGLQVFPGVPTLPDQGILCRQGWGAQVHQAPIGWGMSMLYNVLLKQPSFPLFFSFRIEFSLPRKIRIPFQVSREKTCSQTQPLQQRPDEREVAAFQMAPENPCLLVVTTLCDLSPWVCTRPTDLLLLNGIQQK